MATLINFVPMVNCHRGEQQLCASHAFTYTLDSTCRTQIVHMRTTNNCFRLQIYSIQQVWYTCGNRSSSLFITHFSKGLNWFVLFVFFLLSSHIWQFYRRLKIMAITAIGHACYVYTHEWCIWTIVTWIWEMLYSRDHYSPRTHTHTHPI